MRSLVEKVRKLIQNAKVKEAARFLSSSLHASSDDAIQDELTIIIGQLSALETERRRGTLKPREFSAQQTRLSYQLLELAKLAESEQSLATVEKQPLKLFISYNHTDYEQAVQIKHALEEEGFVIHIDAEQMQAGEDIRSFIRDSIEATDFTLNIVSKNSLFSGWVAIESLLSFSAEELSRQPRFIPCYLDSSFFDFEFRLDVTEAIDQKLADLEQLKIRYNEKHLDSTDLNQEQSRLYELRNQLGTILERLKQSLCVDISPANFESGIAQLIRSLLTASHTEAE